ncbi:MAG: hypothetical protein HXS50_00260 [Theionarchaea archaeon]|nr:hypothetical protein [Theionarchaea archaeon]
MDLIALGLLLIVVVMVFLAILTGKKPVVTEFEARQRGMPVVERTPEENERARKQSDETTGTALQVFAVLGIVLIACALAIFYLAPELILIAVAIFSGIAILFLFVMMWIDEERIKANYEHIRIER